MSSICGFPSLLTLDFKFIGTSIVLAIPLLILRKQRGSVARLSLKGSTAPPPRKASGTAAALPLSSSGTTATTPISLHETIKESLNEDSTSLMSALSRMNSSSALLAAKAFGIATGLVALGGFGTVWAAKTTLGVQDVCLKFLLEYASFERTHVFQTREFAHKMRTLIRLTAPGLMDRIRRAPETDEERHEAHSLAPFGSHEKWNWLDAEKRLQKAYEEGGVPLWAQTALREMEAEARLERSNREQENGIADH